MLLMRFFHIQSPTLLYKILLCVIIISIRQLIKNLIIPNQLHADNFAPVTETKLLAVFL